MTTTTPPASSTPERPAGTSRRTVLQGAATVGLAVGAGAVLAACGSSSTPAATTPTTETPTPSADSSSPSSGTSSAASGTDLGPTSGVPVGGGTIYADQQVVVTQPTAGTYKGFSAVCTHQGCIVAQVTGGEIVCNCHGSHFSITDGSVISGPAMSALPAKSVSVSGSEIVLQA